VEGSDPGLRAERATEIAENMEADLIIYGSLRNDSRGSQVTMEFVVTRRLLRLSEEITGAHQWAPSGVQESIRDNPTARKLLRDLLSGNIKVLAQLVIGIGYYKLDQFGEAEKYFADAGQNEGLRDEIELLVLLFQGSTAAQKGDFELARSLFTRSLEIRPDFAPSRLALANTTAITQLKTGCVAEKMNVEILDQAKREYQALRSAPLPTSGDLTAKAAFGLARLYACISQSGIDEGWELAQKEYEAIIQEYEGGNASLRDLAAEAHADLGLGEIREAPEPGPSEYLSALDQYTKAIEINPHTERQAAYYAQMANTHLLLGACKQAREALDEAGAQYDLFKQTNPHIRREDFENFFRIVSDKWETQCGT
jgi:tetratricopeptide (TPR) repeat protein